jgi:hypothetical protein
MSEVFRLGVRITNDKSEVFSDPLKEGKLVTSMIGNKLPGNCSAHCQLQGTAGESYTCPLPAPCCIRRSDADTQSELDAD